MDPQFKSDILIAISMVFIAVMILRYLPRFQAKMMGVPFISPETAKRMLEGEDEVVVIDVRTPSEFTGDLGHIDGALNMDSHKLFEKINTLGNALEPYKSQPILITCRTQNRSPKAARILYQNGFSKLLILDGGMVGWNRAGYPIRKG